MWSSESSSFDLLLTDDRKSEVLFQVSFTVLKQDSLFATSLLLQPLIPEMNLLRQFAVITIGRKVQTTERSCWAVKRIAKNQIPCQITKRIAKMISSLLISMNSQFPVKCHFYLLYQMGKQLRSRYKHALSEKWNHKKRHIQIKHEQKTKKNYTKNYKGKGNRKSVILALPDGLIPAKCSKWDLVDC